MTRPAGVDPPAVTCPQCGHYIAPDPLTVAEHHAKHLDWQHNHAKPGEWKPWHLDRLDAYRAYSRELEKAVSRLNGDLCDVKAELRVERDRADQAEANLASHQQYGAMDQ